jgi:hypothetical protein
MEDRVGFERIGACEVNAVRHLLVASTATGDCAIRGGLVIKAASGLSGEPRVSGGEGAGVS